MRDLRALPKANLHLHGAGLTEQYRIARQIGCGDEQLAALARHSIEASAAPPEVRQRLLAGVAHWLGSTREAELTHPAG